MHARTHTNAVIYTAYIFLALFPKPLARDSSSFWPDLFLGDLWAEMTKECLRCALSALMESSLFWPLQLVYATNAGSSHSGPFAMCWKFFCI